MYLALFQLFYVVMFNWFDCPILHMRKNQECSREFEEPAQHWKGPLRIVWAKICGLGASCSSGLLEPHQTYSPCVWVMRGPWSGWGIHTKVRTAVLTAPLSAETQNETIIWNQFAAVPVIPELNISFPKHPPYTICMLLDPAGQC